VRPRRGDPLADPEQLIPRIYSYVAYIVGEGADAEDITGATIERALRYRASYDPRRGSPVAWMLGIARNCIADRHHEPLAASEAELDELEATEGSLDHADRLAVQAAVAKLGPRDRELIALRYGADLTTRQIAEELGLQANAVDVALHRAHARLRALLVEVDAA
jgi:RNA polymerase sigma-70 factor, ECF subfamily